MEQKMADQKLDPVLPMSDSMCSDLRRFRQGGQVEEW